MLSIKSRLRLTTFATLQFMLERAKISREFRLF
ncbi:hypothetical protein BN949_00388 [Agrobacterium tumefaciens]|nr:hypothetical protein BN949_00388 [Agrobacterium tumefaciens]